MSEMDDWVGECRAALAQAERLAVQLGRIDGGTAMQLDVFARRIATLRAAIEALEASCGLAAPPEPTTLTPKWMLSAGSPWCALREGES